MDNNKRFLVTIIVPFYNRESSLDYCIESIITQSFDNYELILVNDGSDDNSINICEKWVKIDSRIIFITQENKGAAAARNLGIENAKGDYLLFVDSDDILPTDYVRVLVDSILELGDKCIPTVSLIKNASYEVACKEKEKIDLLCRSKKISIEIVDGRDFQILHENEMLYSPVNKLFFRKRVEEKHIRFKTDLSIGEDFLFNLDYLDSDHSQYYVIISDMGYLVIEDGRERLSKKYAISCEHAMALERIYKKMEKIADYFQLRDSQRGSIEKIKSDYFRMMLRATMEQKELRFFERIRKNSELIRTNEFINWFDTQKKEINPIWKYAYGCRSYFAVWVIQQIKR